MASNGKYFLDVPTKKGLIAAGIAIAVFLVVAYGLYLAGGKSSADFGIKVADFLLQGALVSLLFAILKAIIDEP
jgi:cell shape-determining protein MreD